MKPIAVLLLSSALLAVPRSLPAQGADAAALIKDGQSQLDGGNVDGAIERFRAAVTANPQSYDAHDALGRALDLQGQYQEARQHLEQAISIAPEASRNQALTTMGISFAFEAKPDEAARYYQRVFDAQMQATDPAAAAATANALARIYLESGRLDKAEQWYRTGYETSKRLSERPASQVTLWDLRWEHALGRVAARRGRRAEALKHAASVKSLLDKGGNENQRPVYPYLLGYIEFYTRHYKEAVAQLKEGDQTDPFVLGLIASAYQKTGDTANARSYAERVMLRTVHSINAAFARPAARALLKRPH